MKQMILIYQFPITIFYKKISMICKFLFGKSKNKFTNLQINWDNWNFNI